MADVHEQDENHDARGIKLFGKTIAVEAREYRGLSNKAISKGCVDDDDDDDEKTMEKRPEKLIPCPRCKSTETKFCYFNNYNVNQPRHFCKGCQRYWTAGGALRNVPVGAGRRKAKPPSCRGLSGLSEGFWFDASPGVHQLDFGEAVEEWHAAAEGDFRHVFQAKRRKSTAGGQSC